MHIVKASYHDEVARLFSQLAGVGVKRVGRSTKTTAWAATCWPSPKRRRSSHGIELAARSSYARNTVAVEGGGRHGERQGAGGLSRRDHGGRHRVRQTVRCRRRAAAYGMSIIDTDALLKALGPERSRGYAFSVVLPLAQQTQRAVVREYLQLRDASKDATSRRARSRASSPPRRWSGARRHRQLTPAGVTAALAAARIGRRGRLPARLQRQRPAGSHYVDFAMFGAQGAHPAVAAAARPSADTLVAPFFTFTAARP